MPCRVMGLTDRGVTLLRYDTKKREAFYGTAAWRNVRKAALIRDHYWCCRCRKRPADTVHHLIHVEDAPEKAMDLDNLQSICRQCHNQLHPEKGGKDKESEMPLGVRVVVIK